MLGLRTEVCQKDYYRYKRYIASPHQVFNVVLSKDKTNLRAFDFQEITSIVDGSDAIGEKAEEYVLQTIIKTAKQYNSYFSASKRNWVNGAVLDALVALTLSFELRTNETIIPEAYRAEWECVIGKADVISHYHSTSIPVIISFATGSMSLVRFASTNRLNVIIHHPASIYVLEYPAVSVPTTPEKLVGGPVIC